MLCVWRGLARGKPVCRLKTSPCVGSKRIRVYWQNARMCSTYARFDSTHTRRGGKGGWVGGWERGGGWFSSLSFSLPFSLSLLSFSSLFPLLSSLSPLSAIMTMITRPVGLSLCTHGSDLPERQSACTLAHSLFGRTCSYHITVQASCHLE